MPSNKDPNSAVSPGPGRLPAGVVTAGALLFPPGGGGGGSDEALEIHIENPIDAHLASAIGVGYNNNTVPNVGYDSLGNPVLSSVGGTVDGESVLDFIVAVKDLFPTRPSSIGANTSLCSVLNVFPYATYNPTYSIVNATNYGVLIQIETSIPNLLVNGDTVIVSGVQGTSEANGTWTITVLDPTHFALNETVFYNTYTTGGSVFAAGGLIQIHSSTPTPLETGDTVVITGVNGTVEANGTWAITVVDSTNFLLNNSSFQNVYSGNGQVSANSGIPNWGVLAPSGLGFLDSGVAVTGGYASGSTAVSTRYLLPATATSFTLSGTIYPADRGVLVLYSNIDGDFLDPGNTTIVSVLSLGSPALLGLPYVVFDETLRTGKQLDYTNVYNISNVTDNLGYFEITTTSSNNFASGNVVNILGVVGNPADGNWTITVIDSTHFTLNGSIFSGLYAGGGTVQNQVDQFSLTWRLPYLESYSSSAPYSEFEANFTRYQLASYTVDAQTVAAGGNQNWLLVHWKETYATTVGSIQPSALTLINLTPANCYSATPNVHTISNVTNSGGLFEVATSVSTNFSSGDVVDIQNVLGTTGANGQWVITVINSTHFTLNGSTYSGSYLSGGLVVCWDLTGQNWINTNRHFVFQDTNSAGSPAGSHFTSSENGTPATAYLSGIQYFNTSAITWTVDVRATGLFDNSFQTGSVANSNIPSGYTSAFDPIQFDFTNFGGGIFKVPYYVMNHNGTPSPLYGPTNAPQIGQTGQYTSSTLAIPSPTNFCPSGGYAQLTVDLYSAFQSTVYQDTALYLYDSYPQNGGGLSTSTYEPFVDEYYRYTPGFNPASSSLVPIIATGGNVFNSSSHLTPGGNSLQVTGHALVYPQMDYTSGFHPSSGQPDYSGFPYGDGVDHRRTYIRAIDTGVARNTGWIRLRGLTPGNINATSAYDGNENTGHTGAGQGAIVLLQVPGPSGSGNLDLGRKYGDPGLAMNDFYGCQTGVVVSGGDTYISYNTSAFTSFNGTGNGSNFLLFVRVVFLNGPGTSLTLQEFEWYPPTFVPPTSVL